MEVNFKSFINSVNFALYQLSIFVNLLKFLHILLRIPKLFYLYLTVRIGKKIITLWELTATGTRKMNEVYIFESVSYSMEFSTDGKIFVMMGNDYKTCYIYNALNLELISKWELKGQDGNGYDLTYFYTMYPSYDGSYLLSGDTYSRWVFDNQGKFIKCFNASNVYTMYMYSKNEYLGIKPNESYTKTNLVAFDFINGIEKQFYEFDSYVGSVNLSPEFNAFTYDQYPKYMYCNMKGNKEKFEVFKEYTTVNKVVFKGDKLGIVNSINYTITNISLYHGDKVLWKHTLKRSWVDIRDLKFADKESDNLIMIEYYNSEFIIYLFNKDGYSDFYFKAMRDVIFQYPYIIYGRGSKEIWVQNMENKVEIYYFDNNIQAIENTSRFRDLTYGGMSLGMVMDYHDYFSISRLETSYYGKSYKYFKRKFNKNELLNQSVKSYNRIRVQNAQRKKIEEAVLFHLNNSLILLSLESRDFKHEIQRSFKERNIVWLTDNSAIYLWDDNGDKIEMLKSGFDPSSSNYLIKVFEADEDIRLVKSTIIDGIEYLLVVDEQKHWKLLKNEEARSIVYKDYYVDSYFSTSQDVMNVQSYSYSNGMLYSNSGGIMLQEKGNEKESKFYNLSFSTMSFDYNRPYFPICSENYILYSLYGEYNADYTSMYSYLLLAPPMNKQRINQRSKVFYYGYSCELFLHFDDKYVIELKNNYGQIEFKVYSLNGEVVQTLNVSIGDNSGDPIFSQSGEYFAIIWSIPPEEQDVKFFPKKADPNAYSYFSETDPIRAPAVKLFRLRRTEEYKKQQAIKDASVLDQNNNAQKLKEILKVDFVKKFDIPHECLKQGFYGSDDSFVYEWSESNAKQKLHVDNKGNVIVICPSRSLLLVNGKNEWSTFNEYITKYKFENYDALEIFKYGQGIIWFKKEEKIFTIW